MGKIDPIICPTLQTTTGVIRPFLTHYFLPNTTFYLFIIKNRVYPLTISTVAKYPNECDTIVHSFTANHLQLHQYI